MCGRYDFDHLDPDIAQADALQGDTQQWLAALCSTCKGRGTVIGGDAIVSCPACHGRVECGSCGRMVASAHPLTQGRVTWMRCDECRARDEAGWREATA